MAFYQLIFDIWMVGFSIFFHQFEISRIKSGYGRPKLDISKFYTKNYSSKPNVLKLKIIIFSISETNS